MSLPRNIERRVKQHVYAADQEFFAIVQPGFEKTLVAELMSLGIAGPFEETEGGVAFRCGVKDIWKIHAGSRCATRVLMRLAHFKSIYFEKFFEKMSEIPWELHLTPVIPVDVSVSCTHSKLYHTDRLKTESMNAIKKRLESAYKEKRGLIEGEGQKIFVRFVDDLCTVSLDCTGEPLYRRGFRTFVEEAPLRETLSALMLNEARIENYDGLLDPMCGSGIIPIEAAMIAQGILPGSRRKFAFEWWPGHSEKGFAHDTRTLAQTLRDRARTIQVFASDIDARAAATTQKNLEQSGLTDAISVQTRDFFALDAADYPQKLLLAMNPPYGERLGTKGNILAFYRRIGEKVNGEFANAGFAIIAPGPDAEKALALDYDRKILFMNGGIKVALLLCDAGR
jgi:putative N6-adenine-specific DNA methylase